MKRKGHELVEGEVLNATGLISKNIKLINRRTSVRLEQEMWDALYEVAADQNLSVHELCQAIDLRKRERLNFSSAIRVFLLQNFRLKGEARHEWAMLPCDLGRAQDLYKHYALLRRTEKN